MQSTAALAKLMVSTTMIAVIRVMRRMADVMIEQALVPSRQCVVESSDVEDDLARMVMLRSEDR